MNDDARIRIGNKLKDAREYLGISQEEAAKIAEIPRSAISLIESGQRKLICVGSGGAVNQFVGARLLSQIIEYLGQVFSIGRGLHVLKRHRDSSNYFFASSNPGVQLHLRGLVDGAHAVHLWHDQWRRNGLDSRTPQHPGSLWEQLRSRYGA